MKENVLLVYLNDHRAGAVAALETIERLREIGPPTVPEHFLRQLDREIREDTEVLSDLIGRFGGEESKLKKTVAWLAEKVERLKLSRDDPSDEAFALFQHLEILLLGIRGKRALWEVLEVVCRGDARFDEFDWHRLKQKADKQMDQVEIYRLDTARMAFLDLEED
jgi:hypothetical protein